MSAPGPNPTCDAVADHLGDFREGALAEPWRSRVALHLQQCEDCAALHETLAELSLLLHVDVPEPSAGFEERIADSAATLSPDRAQTPTGIQIPTAPQTPPAEPIPTTEPTPSVLGFPWPKLAATAKEAWRLSPLPLAATLAVALSGALLLGLPEDRLPEPARRLLARGATARELLMERQERLLEDAGALRLVVGGAFSSRVERIQEQLEDYRRLVAAPERRKPAAAPVHPQAESNRSFENFPAPAPVAVDAGQVAPPPRPARA